jgi:putative SOS response-associated peptidase YedK
MCGRFVSSNSPDQIASYFGASFESEPLGENFNVAPTSDVYGVVAGNHHERSIRAFHWGLVPSWAKDIRVGSKMINARAETLAEKPSFKKLFAGRRLLVPMSGFFEWKAVPGRKVKQPYFIHRPDGVPLAAAGLWTAWRDPDQGDGASWLHSCTIITTSANQLVSSLHDRMPAFVDPADWDTWLDPDLHDVALLAGLLAPSPESLLELVPVSTDVNNVRNKGSHLVDRVEPEL